MSIAGVRSNRGDIYQTLVAFDWALSVLSDSDLLWVEVDSIAHMVDDVVIGKADGSLIACQCKKNQTDFKAWSLTDLAGELHKASSFLSINKGAEVRFYSRSNFGQVAKLREHSATQDDEAGYKLSLGMELQEIDAALEGLLSSSAGNVSSYDFLRRTSFAISDELDRMVQHLRERLRGMTSNPNASFNALWTCLDQLGARALDSPTAASRHRLTKEDIKEVITKAGSMLAPRMSLEEVRASFACTSAIGRSWRRDIAGHRLAGSIIKRLLAAIDAKQRAVLLTGLPGSGKTCAMLALQDELEQRAKSRRDIVPLFIQSRDFADLVTGQDRQSQGLAEQWVEEVARMAEESHVVVVVDSLDVLSIARDHRVITYFLAQMDRLLLVENVTVVTACRDFDRHYDRRIAERVWDCELRCDPLDWEGEVAPLLEQLGLITASVDKLTQDLLRNPRELALFVELAKCEGSFSVVSSRALAQRYLDVFVRADSTLGDAAVQAIETLATDMLKSRSLAVAHQRFAASQDVCRRLCSLNVIQETEDRKLTFGHQTLLDVLVISKAVRSGLTLFEFIKGLPQVPFVRPSIRGFVAELASGDRREFRKQIRTVLTGGCAFHIRRLVAESFADQRPEDEDWPLIRDLRTNHLEVFQVVYAATAVEWHRFWLKHLIPSLKASRDKEGMTAHVYRVTGWSNADVDGVLAFWTDALSLEWLDRVVIADHIGFHLSDMAPKSPFKVAAFIERILEFPRSEHSSLGSAVARCVEAGAVDDSFLWRYISGDVSDECALGFDIRDKLRCGAHEFNDEGKGFIRRRLTESTHFLDVVLREVERWSNLRASRYGEFRRRLVRGFLHNTSFEDVHSQRDTMSHDSLDILFDGVEAAINFHAQTNSEWWRENRWRLCSSRESSIIYYLVLACTESPLANIDLVSHLLCDKELLESEISYELGNLIKVAFFLLDYEVQDTVLENVVCLHNAHDCDDSIRPWVLRARAELIAAIPRSQRSPGVQAILDGHDSTFGTLIRQPEIHSAGGSVTAPFSYEVFLDSNDVVVLSLLSHYTGYEGRFDDFLVGGEREVGSQLREAASRDPSRFTRLLSNFWMDLSIRFRDDIMDGIASYLACRHGNLQASRNWEPVDVPDASVLVSLVLNELELHQTHWRRNRSAARALEACANIVIGGELAYRLVFLAVDYHGFDEEDPIQGDNVDLISLGLNLTRGDIATALIILAENCCENGVEFPELLVPAMRRFAGDKHPAVRAVVLRRLPYLQSKAFDLGWELFDIAMRNPEGLWEISEKCLYYAYHGNFVTVQPWLARLRSEGAGKSLETWGRISALAAMQGRIGYAEFLEDLRRLGKADAWRGAATVWTNLENMRSSPGQCISGLEVGLTSDFAQAQTVAKQLRRIFDDKFAGVKLPIELVKCCFDVFKVDGDARGQFYSPLGLHCWLNAVAQYDSLYSLSALEIYLDYVGSRAHHVYDHRGNLAQLMTRLFAEAEEREESDCGVMLQRVVVAQDALLSMGVNGMAEWLRAAERPD